MRALRRILSIGVILSVLFLGAPALHAGDEEWADAGKILAGVVGGVVGYHILTNMYGDGYGCRDCYCGGCCYEPPRRCYAAPVAYYDDYYCGSGYVYDSGYSHGYRTGYRHGYRRGRCEAPAYGRRVVRYYRY